MSDLLFTLNPLSQAQVHRPVNDVVWMLVDLSGSTDELAHSNVAASIPVMKMVAHNAIVASWVTANDGVVLKFLGDGALAQWLPAGGPVGESVAKAARAALAIAASVDAFNQDHGDRVIRTKIGLHIGRAYVCDYRKAVDLLLHSQPASKYLSESCKAAGLLVPPDDPHGIGPATVARITGWATEGQLLASGTFCDKLPSGACRVGPRVRVPLKGLGRFEVAEILREGDGLGVRNRRYDTSADLVQDLRTAKQLYDIGLKLLHWNSDPGSALTHLGSVLTKNSEILARNDSQACHTVETAVRRWGKDEMDRIVREDLPRLIERLLGTRPPEAASELLTRAKKEEYPGFLQSWQSAMPWDPTRWTFLGAARILEKEHGRRLMDLEECCSQSFQLGQSLLEGCDIVINDLIREVEYFS